MIETVHTVQGRRSRPQPSGPPKAGPRLEATQAGGREASGRRRRSKNAVPVVSGYIRSDITARFFPDRPVDNSQPGDGAWPGVKISPAPSGPRDRPERSGRKVRTPLRAACRVTPGRGNAKESATENRPPSGLSGDRTVRVKRCGKSAPPRRQRRGHGKPHAEQGQIGKRRAPDPSRDREPLPGRLLELEGDFGPRGMIALPHGRQNSAYRPARGPFPSSKFKVQGSRFILRHRPPTLNFEL